jgi:hypothetical protein
MGISSLAWKFVLGRTFVGTGVVGFEIGAGLGLRPARVKILRVGDHISPNR